MTVTEALVLSLLIALWSAGTGVNLANNTVIIITLLIALVSLAFSTTRQNRGCQNAFLNAQNGGLFNTSFFT